MSVTDEHRISPSKILTKNKKSSDTAEEKAEGKDGDKDAKQGGKINKKSNALIDFIAKNKKASKE